MYFCLYFVLLFFFLDFAPSCCIIFTGRSIHNVHFSSAFLSFQSLVTSPNHWVKHSILEWAEPVQATAHSVADRQPSYYYNRRRLCTGNVQYICLTVAYLTTICQVIIKLFFLHIKRFAATLKMFIFTINCHTRRHVYITTSNGRGARSLWKFLPSYL